MVLDLSLQIINHYPYSDINRCAETERTLSATGKYQYVDPFVDFTYITRTGKGFRYKGVQHTSQTKKDGKSSVVIDLKKVLSCVDPELFPKSSSLYANVISTVVTPSEVKVITPSVQQSVQQSTTPSVQQNDVKMITPSVTPSSEAITQNMKISNISQALYDYNSNTQISWDDARSIAIKVARICKSDSFNNNDTNASSYRAGLLAKINAYMSNPEMAKTYSTYHPSVMSIDELEELQKKLESEFNSLKAIKLFTDFIDVGETVVHNAFPQGIPIMPGKKIKFNSLAREVNGTLSAPGNITNIAFRQICEGNKFEVSNTMTVLLSVLKSISRGISIEPDTQSVEYSDVNLDDETVI